MITMVEPMTVTLLAVFAVGAARSFPSQAIFDQTHDVIAAYLEPCPKQILIPANSAPHAVATAIRFGK